MELVEMQFAWFIMPSDNINYEDLVCEIRKSINIDLVSPAQFFPTVTGFVPEYLMLPRVQLNNLNNTKRIVIAGNRIDCYFNKNDLFTLDKNRQQKFKSVINDLDSIFKKKSYEIIRYGCVCRYVDNKKKSLDKARELMKKPSKLLLEASIRLVERKNTDNCSYNLSVSYEDILSKNSIGNSAEKVLLITKDINTVFIENTKCTSFKDFFNVVEKEKIISENN